MNDIKNYQELLEILEKQEEMLGLLEDMQTENEKLEQELQKSIQELMRLREELEEAESLNESLNNENKKLLRQIEELTQLS